MSTHDVPHADRDRTEPPTAPATAPALGDRISVVLAMTKAARDLGWHAWQAESSDAEVSLTVRPVDQPSHEERRAALAGPEPEVPRCQNVSASPWGPTQCALPEHDESVRHAYSPSETSDG